MSGQEVIEQIKALPQEERAEVIEDVRSSESANDAPAASNPRKDVKTMIEKIFAEHDELFRKLAQ